MLVVPGSGVSKSPDAADCVTPAEQVESATQSTGVRGEHRVAGKTTLTLPVAETFQSRQGEGALTGIDSHFIRTSGCNLRCWFCDTPYASWQPQGESRTVASLVTECLASGANHVVLTGGEPLLPRNTPALVHALRTSGLHVTIETAGTIDVQLGCDLLSLSPKLANSTPDAEKHPAWSKRHESRRMPIEIMRRLIDQATQHQVKFVVSLADQMDEITALVNALHVAADQVWLMPQGVTVNEMDAAQQWLQPLAESAGYRYCDRMQIRWFGNRRGT
ncbi:MAG: 7-carboxy-7-deazaguanine synthase QueE [Planctomycetota bacterium]